MSNTANRIHMDLQLSTSGILVPGIQLSRASKQYLFDCDGRQYLDCVSAFAQVGHCHPQVVAAGQVQMARLTTAQGFLSDELSNYVTRLAATLPDSLNVVYLCNSPNEANDLALRLAKQFTGNRDLLCFEKAFHGTMAQVVEVSPKLHSMLPHLKPNAEVHVLPLPDSRTDEQEAEALLRASQVELIIRNRVLDHGRHLAALISEPIFFTSGLYMPHKVYMDKVYQAVREAHGLCIADETNTGLGRMGGKYLWSFQLYDVVPDIVTVGRQLGNGHPMSAVICRKEVANALGGYFSTYGGNPVSCAMGSAVLDVMHNEKLRTFASSVGLILRDLLVDLKAQFPALVTQVRGHGLIWAIDIASPDPGVASSIVSQLKERNILVGMVTSGSRHHDSGTIFHNSLVLMPPMCFTIENGHTLVDALYCILRQLHPRFERNDPPRGHEDGLPDGK